MVKVELGFAIGGISPRSGAASAGQFSPGPHPDYSLRDKGNCWRGKLTGDQDGKGSSHWRGRSEGGPMNPKLGLMLLAIVLCVAAAVASGAQQPNQQQSAPEAQQPPPAQPGPPQTPEGGPETRITPGQARQLFASV